jgi:hypothetical protein
MAAMRKIFGMNATSCFIVINYLYMRIKTFLSPAVN